MEDDDVAALNRADRAGAIRREAAGGSVDLLVEEQKSPTSSVRSMLSEGMRSGCSTKVSTNKCHDNGLQAAMPELAGTWADEDASVTNATACAAQWAREPAVRQVCVMASACSSCSLVELFVQIVIVGKARLILPS